MSADPLEPLPDDVRELLRQETSRAPLPESAVEQAWRGLTPLLVPASPPPGTSDAGGGVANAGLGGSASGSTTLGAGGVGVAGVSGLTKAVAVGAAGLALITGSAILIRASREPSHDPAVPARSAPATPASDRERVEAVEVPTVPVAVETLPVAPPSAPPTSNEPRTSAPSPLPASVHSMPQPSSGLENEQRDLSHARALLRGGDATRALQALEEQARRYTRGQLSLERQVLTIQALSGSGQAAEALRRAKVFEKEHPDSALLQVLQPVLTQTMKKEEP